MSNLRLVQLLVAAEHRDRAMEILRADERSPQWDTELGDGRVLVQAILPAAGNEPVLDELETAFRDTEGYRILFLPVEATVPRLDEEDDGEGDRPEKEPPAGEGEDDPAGEEDAEGKGKGGGEPAEEADGRGEGGRDRAILDSDEEVGSERVPARINREELYADVTENARPTPFYLVMVALSAVVACSGLMLDDVAVIIGAMVIAPLIGPSMGIALATTLGDLRLGRQALWASVAGVGVAFGIAAVVGVVLEVNPEATEIAGRTELAWGHLSLALAAGAAGAASLAQGVGAVLVGVMVSVALLPPLAVAGLLLGSGHVEAGMGALILTAANIVCVNLAATGAFLAQGVRPHAWWEGEHRTRAIWVAAVLWGGLLVALALLLVFA